VNPRLKHILLFVIGLSPIAVALASELPSGSKAAVIVGAIAGVLVSLQKAFGPKDGGPPTPPPAAALLLLLPLLHGCAHRPTVSGVIDCTEVAVEQHLPDLVAACLATSSSSTCLDGLITPGVATAEDAVACVLRAYAGVAEATGRSSAQPTALALEAARARDFIELRGWRFR